MADQQQSYLLRQGVDAWNTWRTQHKKVKPNLRGAALSEANLSGANLSEADLNRADLSFAHFSGANLNFAHFRGATLIGADLSGATLIGADLSRATLGGAVFSKAIMLGTIFGNVDLRMVKGLETIVHFGPSTIGTDTLMRSEGDIPEVFLREAGLSDTFITYARSLAQHPIEYYTCFISYSSKDQEFAERLYTDLRSKGVHCW